MSVFDFYATYASLTFGYVYIFLCCLNGGRNSAFLPHLAESEFILGLIYLVIITLSMSCQGRSVLTILI